jgi:hypothetical protein
MRSRYTQFRHGILWLMCIYKQRDDVCATVSSYRKLVHFSILMFDAKIRSGYNIYHRTATVEVFYCTFTLMDTLFGIQYHLACKGILWFSLYEGWVSVYVLQNLYIAEWNNSAIPDVRRMCNFQVYLLLAFFLFRNVFRGFAVIWLGLAHLVYLLIYTLFYFCFSWRSSACTYTLILIPNTKWYTQKHSAPFHRLECWNLHCVGGGPCPLLCAGSTSCQCGRRWKLSYSRRALLQERQLAQQSLPTWWDQYLESLHFDMALLDFCRKRDVLSDCNGAPHMNQAEQCIWPNDYKIHLQDWRLRCRSQNP